MFIHVCRDFSNVSQTKAYYLIGSILQIGFSFLLLVSVVLNAIDWNTYCTISAMMHSACTPSTLHAMPYHAIAFYSRYVRWIRFPKHISRSQACFFFVPFDHNFWSVFFSFVSTIPHECITQNLYVPACKKDRFGFDSSPVYKILDVERKKNSHSTLCCGVKHSCAGYLKQLLNLFFFCKLSKNRQIFVQWTLIPQLKLQLEK